MEYKFNIGKEPKSVTVTNETLWTNFKSSEARCPLIKLEVLDNNSSGKALTQTTGLQNIKLDTNGNLVLTNNAQQPVNYTVFIVISTEAGVSSSRKLTVSFLQPPKAPTTFTPTFVVK